VETSAEPSSIAALRREIEHALRRAFDPADVLPRLARLARLAKPSSDDGVFAHRQLAELLVERHPWRAALYARRALAHRGHDDRAWAILAFCQTLLGNFHCAASAYRQAISCAPSNPWYAHNLGHLLDVALGQPARALGWLRAAYDAKGDNSEIVASYAHALARAGHTNEARLVLERALDRFESRELEAILRWLDQGAPSRASTHERPRATSVKAPARTRARAKKRAPPKEDPSLALEAIPVDRASRTASRPSPVGDREPRRDRRLARVLERGLSHLPFDSRQRERALALARDALPARMPTTNEKRTDDVAGLAAAVAYAIVYVNHVPLSQAEVAAPFRVAVGRLRGRFAELRAKLDIIPGDARYATTLR
jgi:Flp pilus assembly protein TadD